MKTIKNHLTQPLFSYSGAFLSDYLEGQLGRSPNTITSYRCCMRRLRDFIEQKTEKSFFKFTFGQADRDFFLDYLCWVEKSGAGKATRNQRLACLKTYARYVMDCDFELTRWGSGLLSIPMATAEKPMIGWLREDALKSILEQPEDSRFGNRDLAFMILMYESGARIGEIMDIPGEATYEELSLELLENLAEGSGVERFRVYDVREFLSEISKNYKKMPENDFVRQIPGFLMRIDFISKMVRDKIVNSMAGEIFEDLMDKRG